MEISETSSIQESYFFIFQFKKLHYKTPFLIILEKYRNIFPQITCYIHIYINLNINIFLKDKN